MLGGTDISAQSDRQEQAERTERAPAASDLTTETVGATLYVDTENLQDSSQTLVQAVIDTWPNEKPPLKRLNLYVQADQTQLWEMWAESQFSHVPVTVHGIQHFSKQPSKNAADIAMAIDAVADFVSGTTQFVAVMSDDSDFMALYAKLRELNEEETPFLWVVTDRDMTRSVTIRDYFPNDHIHVVHFPTESSETKTPSAPPTPKTKKRGGESKQLAEMVELIIEKIPVSVFKSTQCQPIIKKGWPNHPLAGMPGPSFGTEFAKKLWPMLEKRGVKLKKEKPRKYEMTEDAKRSLKKGKGGA